MAGASKTWRTHFCKMCIRDRETMVPETSMPVRADKDAQKSEKTGAEEEKTILGKLYVAGIGPGSLDGMTKEAFKAIGDCQVTVSYTHLDVYKRQVKRKTE